jgi:hypothetical protein
MPRGADGLGDERRLTRRLATSADSRDAWRRAPTHATPGDECRLTRRLATSADSRDAWRRVPTHATLGDECRLTRRLATSADSRDAWRRVPTQPRESPLLHVVLISFAKVAPNIITYLWCAVVLQIAWTSRRMSNGRCRP